MKMRYTFTASDDDYLNDDSQRNTSIAMAGAVDIMNELLVSDDMKFKLGLDNDIRLVDAKTDEVLKLIPQQEIMQIARTLGVLQNLTVH